ncbi:MAG: hypothetical protein NZ523_12555 [Elioraea sp.]|nr:hypothetical protein [Elioraea sp.]
MRHGFLHSCRPCRRHLPLDLGCAALPGGLALLFPLVVRGVVDQPVAVPFRFHDRRKPGRLAGRLIEEREKSGEVAPCDLAGLLSAPHEARFGAWRRGHA